MINIALPKGRLGERVYRILEQVGYPCPSVLEDNRKLIFENPEAGVRYFWAVSYTHLTLPTILLV